jgi:hypothetical protein
MELCVESGPSLMRRPLAFCLASALGTALSIADASANGRPLVDPIAAASERLPYVHLNPSYGTRGPSTPVQSANSHFVDTCADDGSANSLRVLAGSVPSGHTVDLSQLPLACSTITLDHARGAIVITQDALTVQGRAGNQVTIDGDGHSSVFRHYGGGVLRLNDVTIAHGYFQSGGPPDPLPAGGCIFSSGDVVLVTSTVTDCTVDATEASHARGGAIDAEGYLAVYFSRIANSLSYGRLNFSLGGGAYVGGNLVASYSTIADNAASSDPAVGFSYGGGAWVNGGYDEIRGSTVSGNRALAGGGVFFAGYGVYASIRIISSTISSNVAEAGAGVESKGSMVILASTIVLNGSPGASSANGVFVDGVPVFVQSSIVASNRGAASGRDIGGIGILALAQGSSSNLITSTDLSVPLDTLSACPKLQPLADNGGGTLTHALAYDSPAIDRGTTDPTVIDDQRGAPRTIGAATDIGAVERQPGEVDERLMINGFDGLCDQ